MAKALTPKPLRLSNKVLSEAIQSYGDEEAVVEAALAIIAKRMTRPQDQEQMKGPSDAKKFLTLTLGGLPYEAYWALYLGPQAQVLAAEEIAHGTADGVTSDTRVVAKRALELDASFVIVAHNHPGSIAKPSDEDMTATHRLSRVLEVVGVQLLDAYVVAGNEIGSIGEAMQKKALAALKDKVPEKLRDAVEKVIRENLRPGKIRAEGEGEIEMSDEDIAEVEAQGAVKH